MAEPWSEQLHCIVDVGIWDDSVPWVFVNPPPHKGWINGKNNYNANYDVFIKGGYTSYNLNAIPNSDCNWRWVAYRWKMLKQKWDQVTVEEEHGVWTDSINHQINFSYDQYHPNYYAVAFQVYAEFTFQGSGNLLCNRNGILICDSSGNLIIDR